jgi:hypothetical protein
MNAKQLLILFGFCSIFLIALLMRPNLTGGDTYYFVNYIWGITDTLPHETALSVWLMDLMPANFIAIKLIMCVLTFLSCLGISMSGELLDKKYGWLAGIVLLCTIFFTTIFINFENDLFAFVFIAWSIYLAIKFRVTGESAFLILSIIAIIIAGLIWNYAVYFLIPLVYLCKFDWRYLIFSVAVIGYHFNKFILGIAPCLHYQETQPFISLLAIIFFIVCYTKEFRDKDFFPIILYLTATAILNLKQVYVLMPFLAIALALAVKKMDRVLRIFTILSFLVVLGIVTLTITTMYPNNSVDELFSIAQAIKINEYPEKEINPYWDFGYYWAFFVKDSSLIFEHREPTPKTGIVITRYWDNTLNDLCISRFENKVGKVYVC